MSRFTKIRIYFFRQHLYEDISMVCDDHLSPTNGRKFSSGYETVENIKSVSNA